ncbi:PEP-CTERM sorting domain-containing protein [Candidatus Poribacteria bacterium]|nr:PEP-CTERM sorting domain-containing protein [Candidatus Poribacteria bacterium]
MVSLCKANLGLAVFVILVFGLTTSVQALTIYNAADDFSATNNPNGVWSYGWSSSLGSAFNLYTTPTSYPNGINAWGGVPWVTHNPTASTIVWSSTSWLPGQMIFHPGLYGQFSVVRWIAPSPGSIFIDAMFTGRDSAGTTTDVHVLHNSVSIFDGLVNTFGSGPSFATTRTVFMGDTIDFTVGYGSNGNYYFDNTSLHGMITYTTAIPEPSTFVLFGVGIIGTAIYGYRRWKKAESTPS